MQRKSSKSTGPMSHDGETCDPSRNQDSSGPMLFVEAIHAKEIATPGAFTKRNTKTSEANLSALFRCFVLELWLGRIRQGLDQTLFGLGNECDPLYETWATLCCPSDCDPVALGLTTSGTDCSCSPNYPTPVASDYKGSTGKKSRKGTLAEVLAEQFGELPGKTYYPHPEFAEALMGFPIGWSDLDA